MPEQLSKDVLELPAGRELDCLVAVKVMGDMPAMNITAEPTVLAPVSGGFTSKPVKHYSTDIAAAWEVAEKMKMTVYCPEAPYAGGEYNNENRHVAECERQTDRFRPGYIENFYAEAGTAPLAICRAALRAIVQ